MKKFISVLIFLVLISSPCFAQDLYQYGVTAEIFDNNTVNYKLNLIFLDNPEQTFILQLGTLDSIKIDSVSDCSIKPGVLDTSVICQMNASKKTTIVISYNSDQKVSRNGNYFLFTDSFRMNSNASLVPILIKLPEGTGLHQPIESSYSPSDALIGSDGRRTLVNWPMENLQKGDMIEVSVAYERIGDVVISQIPFQIFIMIIVAIAAGAFAFYKIYWKGKNVKIILPILKKDEKKIFDSIIKNGGDVNQKVIVDESGYSKAKVSKVLKSLEERGVLKIERIGRKNKVHINKNFKNKS
jgi:uncharacterized membrane protein